MSSSTSTPPEQLDTKRRRTTTSSGSSRTNNEDGSYRPSVVPSSSSPMTTSIKVEEKDELLFVPEYDEIGAILYFDMQKEYEDDVQAALVQLARRLHWNIPNSATNSNIIFSHGGHYSVIMAMKKFKNNVIIQGLGSHVLRYVAGYDETQAIGIARSGGLEAAVNAIHTHIGDAYAVRESCYVLHNVFSWPWLQRYDVIDRALIDNSMHRLFNTMDVVSIVGRIMEQHKNSASIQGSVCRLLHSLSRYSPEYHDELKKCTGHVGQALSTHYDDEGLREEAMYFMKTVFDK